MGRIAARYEEIKWEMTSPRLSPERRRALELLAGDRHGVNAELLLYSHGLSHRVLAGLVRTELVVAKRAVMMGESGAMMIGLPWPWLVPVGGEVVAAKKRLQSA
jgi:hypothetical protein